MTQTSIFYLQIMIIAQKQAKNAQRKIMELCLNLDDEDFVEIKKKCSHNENTSYIPKQCPANWFSETNEANRHSPQKMSELKFAADRAYTKKDFNGAIDIYKTILEESGFNRVSKTPGPYRYKRYFKINKKTV